MKTIGLFTFIVAIGIAQFSYASEATPNCSKKEEPGVRKLYIADFRNSETGLIDFQSFDRAVLCARQILGRDPGGNHVTVELNLPEGVIDLSGFSTEGRDAAIDLSGINCVDSALPNCGATLNTPNTTNQFVMKGRGKNTTTIVFPLLREPHHAGDIKGIKGYNVTNITIKGITFTYPRMTVSQGTVKKVEVVNDKTQLDLDIPDGFPSPLELIDTENFVDSGRWVTPAKYVTRAGDPIIYCKNTNAFKLENGDIQFMQEKWDPQAVRVPDPDRAGKFLWRIRLSYHPSFDIEVGDVLVIKGKQGVDVYRFANSAFTTFDNVRWLRKSRGKFQGYKIGDQLVGPLNVKIVNSQILREGPVSSGVVPCIATPDGGPQIGEAPEPGLEGHYFSAGHDVSYNRFYGVGDDPVAFFDSEQSRVVGNVTGNALGRGILFWYSFIPETESALTARGAVDSLSASDDLPGVETIDYCSTPNVLTTNNIVEMREAGRWTPDRRAQIRLLRCN